MDSANGMLWDPCSLLVMSGNNNKYAVMVLNTPINISLGRKTIFNLWQNALVRITVDGGTDRWLTWSRDKFGENAANHPDIITGDMDSIEPDTLKYYSNNKYTKVIFTEDQNETDFTKAVMELKKYCLESDIDIDYILVISNTSGRFDQVIANVNSLFKMRSRWASVKIFLISQCISWLLWTGKHRIRIPVNLRKSKEWCALIPMGNKAIVSTTGLKWNLDNSLMEFGQMVSTSNTYSSEEEDVLVTTDSPLIWSMGIETLAQKICHFNNK